MLRSIIFRGQLKLSWVESNWFCPESNWFSSESNWSSSGSNWFSQNQIGPKIKIKIKIKLSQLKIKLSRLKLNLSRQKLKSIWVPPLSPLLLGGRALWGEPYFSPLTPSPETFSHPPPLLLGGHAPRGWGEKSCGGKALAFGFGFCKLLRGMHRESLGKASETHSKAIGNPCGFQRETIAKL